MLPLGRQEHFSISCSIYHSSDCSRQNSQLAEMLQIFHRGIADLFGSVFGKDMLHLDRQEQVDINCSTYHALFCSQLQS